MHRNSRCAGGCKGMGQYCTACETDIKPDSYVWWLTYLCRNVSQASRWCASPFLGRPQAHHAKCTLLFVQLRPLSQSSIAHSTRKLSLSAHGRSLAWNLLCMLASWNWAMGRFVSHLTKCDKSANGQLQHAGMKGIPGIGRLTYLVELQ